jgi:hypothetical protein
MIDPEYGGKLVVAGIAIDLMTTQSNIFGWTMIPSSSRISCATASDGVSKRSHPLLIEC